MFFSFWGLLDLGHLGETFCLTPQHDLTQAPPSPNGYLVALAAVNPGRSPPQLAQQLDGLFAAFL